MIWIAGTGMYGRVDEVKGLFHVATKFVHVWYFPLIPFRTLLVIEGNEPLEPVDPVRIPLSPKSILIAWMRASLVAFMGSFGCLVLACVFEYLKRRNPNHLGEAVLYGLVGVLLGLPYLGTLALGRPSLARAMVLAERAGLDPKEVADRLAPQQTAPPPASDDGFDDEDDANPYLKELLGHS